MNTHLYRAVLVADKTINCVEYLDNGEEDYYTDVLPAGTPIGRRTGYLARSSAFAAAYRNGFAEGEFEVVKSEPVEFLTDTERLRRQIQRLTAKLAAFEEVGA